MIARFITSLVAVKLNEKNWELKCALVYQSKILDQTITAPVDFVTDFASVPRVPLAYLLAGNTAHEAAVIHDFLYNNKPHPCTRKQADQVFLEAMEITGIVWWRRELMYNAVRLFSAGEWD